MKAFVFLFLFSLPLAGITAIEVGQTETSQFKSKKIDESDWNYFVVGTRKIIDKNPSEHLYYFESKNSLTGESWTSALWISKDQSCDHEKFSPKNIQKTCNNLGGKIEVIDVPAGRFETCHYIQIPTPYLREEYWVGHVPFCTVKKEEDFMTGTTAVHELLKYKF